MDPHVHFWDFDNGVHVKEILQGPRTKATESDYVGELEPLYKVSSAVFVEALPRDPVAEVKIADACNVVAGSAHYVIQGIVAAADLTKINTFQHLTECSGKLKGIRQILNWDPVESHRVWPNLTTNLLLSEVGLRPTLRHGRVDLPS